MAFSCTIIHLSSNEAKKLKNYWETYQEINKILGVLTKLSKGRVPWKKSGLLIGLVRDWESPNIGRTKLPQFT